MLHRRDLLKYGFFSAVLAGCGASGDGSFSAFGVAGGPSSSGTVNIPNVPLLQGRVGLGKATDPSMDRGVAISVDVTKALGGRVELPDGTALVIPPGALPADTTITVTLPTGQSLAGLSVAKYILEPSGLVFSQPILLLIPNADPTGAANAFLSSRNNPIVGSGEQTNWINTNVSLSGTTLVIEIPHFTILIAPLATVQIAFLVLDIPVELLQPGDMLFFLTSDLFPERAWDPGHCAIFVGAEGTPAAQPDSLVEAYGETINVTLNRLNAPLRQGGGAPFPPRFGNAHIYLGPRRALDGQGAGLTPEQQTKIRQFAFSKIGKIYSVVGDSPFGDVLQGTSWGGEDQYSCCSLCEAALESVGRGILHGFQNQFISIPLELYEATKNIPSVDVKVGTEVKIPVYGVMRKSFYQGYRCDLPRTITVDSMPAGATFDASSLAPESGSGDETGPYPGFVFRWTPKPEDVGQTRELKLTMVVPYTPFGETLERTFRRTLSFNVQDTNRLLYNPTKVGDILAFSASLNDNGDIAYIDYGTGNLHVIVAGVDTDTGLTNQASISNLNNLGHFVVNGNRDCKLWRDGTVTNIDPLNGTNPLAQTNCKSLNNSDELAGISYTEGKAFQFSFQNGIGTYIELSIPNVPEEVAINDSGQIAAVSVVIPGLPTRTLYFFDSALAAPQTVDSVLGALSYPTINKKGQVAFLSLTAGDPDYVCKLWDNGVLTTIPLGTGGAPIKLNGQGTIITKNRNQLLGTANGNQVPLKQIYTPELGAFDIFEHINYTADFPDFRTQNLDEYSVSLLDINENGVLLVRVTVGLNSSLFLLTPAT